MQPNEKYNWRRLNHLQLGRYAEYFVKMECVLYGFDVYTTEVDDKGIDFVLRSDRGAYFDVQVKSIRPNAGKYIFFPKDKFELRDNLLAAVVLFHPHKIPDLYLVPATAWSSTNGLFVSRDYQERKSKPEWGLNLSRKNMPLLEQYVFDRMATNLQGAGTSNEGVD